MATSASTCRSEKAGARNGRARRWWCAQQADPVERAGCARRARRIRGTSRPGRTARCGWGRPGRRRPGPAPPVRPRPAGSGSRGPGRPATDPLVPVTGGRGSCAAVAPARARRAHVGPVGRRRRRGARDRAFGMAVGSRQRPSRHVGPGPVTGPRPWIPSVCAGTAGGRRSGRRRRILRSSPDLGTAASRPSPRCGPCDGRVQSARSGPLRLHRQHLPISDGRRPLRRAGPRTSSTRWTVASAGSGETGCPPARRGARGDGRLRHRPPGHRSRAR